jgi:hypothetical protein
MLTIGTMATRSSACSRAVYMELQYSNDKKNDKRFRSCIRDYLESIAQCTNLGDRLQNKPAHMPLEEFLNRRIQILGSMKNTQLHHSQEIPNNQELCDQVIITQHWSHRTKYAKNIKWLRQTCPNYESFLKAATMQMSAVEHASESWTTRKSPKKSPIPKRNCTQLNQGALTNRTGHMTARIGTRIRTGTMMIVGKTTYICHNMTTEMAIATMTLADAMTSALPNNRSGVEIKN